MSDSFLNDYLRTRQRVDQLERIESGGGGSAGAVYLTLTRNSTFSLAAGVGAIVTWQDEVRSNGITWSGSEITIPDDGYYLIDLTYRLSSTSIVNGNILVNGTDVARMSQFYGLGTSQRSTALRYFSASDILEIRIGSNDNRSVQVNAYDTSGESPYLHIVKVA